MRWKAIWSRGSSSMTPGGVRGLIKARNSMAEPAHSSGWRRSGACARAPDRNPHLPRAAATPKMRGSIPRGVAQPGRALRSGRRSRRFKSCLPDHLQQNDVEAGLGVGFLRFGDGFRLHLRYTGPDRVPPMAAPGIRSKTRDPRAHTRLAGMLKIIFRDPMSLLTPAQRGQLLANQLEASRPAYSVLLLMGSALLVLLAGLEVMGWVPGIGYPP